MQTEFDADYFLRGKETGKSLYKDYRWLPDLTLPMAEAIAKHLKFHTGSKVLDFGCARGYLVRAFRELGYAAFGCDVSEWAIANCDESVKDFVSNCITKAPMTDWVIAKDVLEHIPEDDLHGTLCKLAYGVNVGVFAVVPLSQEWGKPYIVPEYEEDVTHCVRMNMQQWHLLFTRALGREWEIESTTRVPGVKDNYYATHPTGNGFITARRKV